jgi:hypothetical protein
MAKCDGVAEMYGCHPLAAIVSDVDAELSVQIPAPHLIGKKISQFSGRQGDGRRYIRHFPSLIAAVGIFMVVQVKEVASHGGTAFSG